jgi:hypothetical protein
MSFRKSSPKCSPAQILSELFHSLNRGEKQTKNLGYFCNFKKTDQSKQSPHERKFAQSGHPDTNHPGRGRKNKCAMIPTWKKSIEVGLSFCFSVNS